MKRILILILAYLFLFTQTASAMPLLVGQKVVYRGTITGLRISAVDGTAFIDNLPLVYSSDFSAGVDGWTATRATVTGNIDSIGGEDNVLRMVITDTSNETHHCQKSNILTIGKKYTVSFKYYILSTNSNVDTIVLPWTTWGGVTTNLTTLDTWTSVTKTFTANYEHLRFFSGDGGNTIFQDAGGDDVFYIKDIKISEIQPYMDGNHQIEIYDSSNRMLKGVLKASTSAETLGAEINTGTLTALTLYKITATEINHFGTGLVVGSYFTSAGAETCDANNKVQQVTAGANASTVVSAKGGEVYNFSYRNASFSYNSSSYYVIIRAIR